MGVAAVHLDDELLTVRTDRVDEEVAGLLAIGGAERSVADAELGERRLDLAEARAATARLADEVHAGRGDDGDEQPGDGAERRGRPEHRDRDGRRADEPASRAGGSAA